MAEQGQDKTEQKSQKKLQDARDKGELPHSQEVATFIVFTVIIIYFSMIGTGWFDGLGRIMADLLQFDKYLGVNRASLGDFLMGPVLKSAFLIAPFFMIVLIVAVIVNMGQTGFNFAKDRLTIDWGRLNPIKGFQKFFKMRAWIEGAKSLLKIGLFTYLAFLTLRDSLASVVELPAHDLRYQLGYLVSLSLRVGTRIAVLMAVLSLGDYFYQWWQFQETLKMTPQEVKEEAKEHEGDPLVRQRMRSIRMQMARKRMMSSVAKADVVVTNPTHYAVAIAYDKTKMSAPYVCGKGTRYLALRIREIAAQHKIPIIENPPVARALYKRVKVGQMIPSEFYKVIAELLAFVYLLKKRKTAGAPTSTAPLKPRFRAALPAAITLDDLSEDEIPLA